MNTKKILVCAAHVVAMIFSSATQATPINWALQNVTFDDGGTASGTFSTDDVTGGLLSYDLTTSTGSTLSGFHYDISDSYLYANNLVGANSFLIVNNSPFAIPYLNFSFDQALNIAGTNTLTLGSSYECYNCSPVRFIATGSATSVPEPATLALLGLGLFGFAAARRRKQ